jgi:hypothetical protein
MVLLVGSLTRFAAGYVTPVRRIHHAIRRPACKHCAGIADAQPAASTKATVVARRRNAHAHFGQHQYLASSEIRTKEIAMNQTAKLKRELKRDVTRLRILRHEVRLQLEIAQAAPSDDWSQMEARLRKVEKAAEDFSETSRGLVADAVRELERFQHALHRRVRPSRRLMTMVHSSGS